MKEKVASITAQRERKTETSANAISTFICHASEEPETSLVQELRLPAASRGPTELLGGTGGLDPSEGTSWGGVGVMQNAQRGAVGRAPVPQPCSSSQPSHRAVVL